VCWRIISPSVSNTQQHVDDLYSRLLIAAKVVPLPTALDVQLCPRISPKFFLQQLSRGYWKDLPEDWKSAVVTYALALAELQRAGRLFKLASATPVRQEELASELQTCGHTNWDPRQTPESLLIEVESGFLIRPVQEDIAAQMRDPDGNRNAVMQLDMGEAKSSVIVPIVAAALADTKQLSRVIVVKPQSKRMAQMLISKLGGLVNHRVYYMPFSRSIKLDAAAASRIHVMLQECLTTGGILLVQPEHILSLKLAAPECYATNKLDVGLLLMSMQDFFDSHARNIIDESDENISVRFELIYTMGMQISIEGSPDRWLMIQNVLDLVAVAASQVLQKLPQSFELHTWPTGSFTRIRILAPDAADMLIHSVACQIRDRGLEGLQLSRQSQAVREAVFTYITRFDLTDAKSDAVEGGLFWTEATKNPVLLLRGLFAGGILAFAFGSKRWRVNYGLASRDPPTKLAVPYRRRTVHPPAQSSVTQMSCLRLHSSGTTTRV